MHRKLSGVTSDLAGLANTSESHTSTTVATLDSTVSQVCRIWLFLPHEHILSLLLQHEKMREGQKDFIHRTREALNQEHAVFKQVCTCTHHQPV